MIATESGESAVSTYDCPVCRKAQILDLDRLQVDPHLTRYIHELRLRDGHAEPMKGIEVPPAADAAMPDVDRQSASAEALNGVNSRQAAQRGQLTLTAVKGVLHNELPSPLPSPRSVVEGGPTYCNQMIRGETHAYRQAWTEQSYDDCGCRRRSCR